jgi:hypothetical protein
MCRYNPHNFTCCTSKIFGLAVGSEKDLHCTPCSKTKSRIDRTTIITIPDQKCPSCRKEWQEEQNAAMALRTMSYNDVFGGQDFDLRKVEEEERVRRMEAAEGLLELRYNGSERVFSQGWEGNRGEQAQSQKPKVSQQPKPTQKPKLTQMPRENQRAQQRQQPKPIQLPEQTQEPTKPTPIFRGEKIYKVERITDSKLYYGKLQYKSEEFVSR